MDAHKGVRSTVSMEEKSNLEQFLGLTELLGNDEMIDPEEEAQFWKSEAGQKMVRAFNSPEHREFLRKLDALRTEQGGNKVGHKKFT